MLDFPRTLRSHLTQHAGRGPEAKVRHAGGGRFFVSERTLAVLSRISKGHPPGLQKTPLEKHLLLFVLPCCCFLGCRAAVLLPGSDLTQRLRSHLIQHAGVGSEAKVIELAGGKSGHLKLLGPLY